MVYKVGSRQLRPQSTALKVGDEMIGSLIFRERRNVGFGEARELLLVRVRDGIMGLLVGNRAELDALDPNLTMPPTLCIQKDATFLN
ncbi:MAG: hypothetical protein WCW67_08075 [Candidatus Margulisiibacteriota bacterium]|jgi:hypothetical protein